MTKGQFVHYASERGLENAEKIPFEILILMPEAWQALGKVGGWDKKILIRRGTIIGNFCTPCSQEHPRGECFKEMGFGMDYLDPWCYHMHRMIDALCEGKTIEQFLENL